MADALLKQLSQPGIDKASLKRYSAHLVAAKAANYKFERIWWKGIPYPDMLHLQTRIPLKNIADIEKLISPELDSIEIFPIGIPYPEFLQAIVKIPLINPAANEKAIGR